jgi:hypothetical protein
LQLQEVELITVTANRVTARVRAPGGLTIVHQSQLQTDFFYITVKLEIFALWLGSSPVANAASAETVSLEGTGMRDIAFGILVGAVVASVTASAEARCSRFVGSTMDVPGLQVANWRTDYPTSSTGSVSPWTKYDFASEPEKYMDAVLATVRPYFRYNGNRLVASAGPPWWIVEWMDYDDHGREPLMGLTKERNPKDHDLSQTSTAGSQVWAVNFYNQAGAVTIGEVFADPCSPKLSSSVLFREGAVAIKFLFTDANLGRFADQVAYLDGGPTYGAWIDPEGTMGYLPVGNRMLRDVQLIQLDFAVKDRRATKTGWVFGTFAWIAPKVGDGLFDNLVPVALVWANDEGVVTRAIKESWINDALRGRLFGWAERPFLGFFGRANGPADNWRSSCLSCHAGARVPESEVGFADIASSLVDFNDPDKVSTHVAKWFKNIPAGQLFDPIGPTSNTPATAIDYSLQIDSALTRMCQACEDGFFPGPTPGVCISARLPIKSPLFPTCRSASQTSVLTFQRQRDNRPLPRQ